jgi:hypothetical protein
VASGEGSGVPRGTPLGVYGDFVARVGVPFAIALLVLAQLVPKIDRGIQIADRVDAELQFLASSCQRPFPSSLPAGLSDFSP